MKRVIALTVVGGVLAVQADIASTLLVNFHNADNTANLTSVTAADYQVNDADVNGSAVVNLVSGGGDVTGGTVFAVGLSGITFSANTANWNDWNTSGGNFAETPILDSYIYYTSTDIDVSRYFRISGFEEIDPGQTVKLTIYGVGDGVDQESQLAITYNGVQSAIQTTDYDSGDVYKTFTFTKVDGVDSVDINWGTANGTTAALSGFSMTSIPEPATLGLIASFGICVIFVRRNFNI
ncbi:hypothetical protein EGM51_11995 [Verrucomicrobia bacterium S94]|nr:hypothetical protein EGM51_11995 [Verrucomicrobia bacterium S94]